MAQPNENTYYYCYAWQDGYGRVFVSNSVRYGSTQDYSYAQQAFAEEVRVGFNIPYFAATGCRPAYASPDRNGVESERINYIQQEQRNGKTVTVVNW